MATHRRVPENVDAVRYDGHNAAAIVTLLGGPDNARVEDTRLPGPGRGVTPGIKIVTFTKRSQAREGDWVARTEASWKVISAKQFEAEYEEV